MAEIKDYSVTADDNDSASPNGMPEGMAPSGVNNSWRESFARVKRWYEDIQGAKTTTGSSNAYVLAAARTVAAYAAGDAYMFKANHTCTAAGSTLNVDSVGAKSIVTPAGAALGAGDITSGGIYIVAYEATADKFMLLAGGSTFSGDIIIKTSDGGILNLQTSDTTVTSGSVLGRTDYQAPDEASGTDAILLAASIAAVATDTFAADNNSTKLSFMTAATAAAAETMSLSSGGNLTLPTDGVVIAAGADSDVTLAHNHDLGLTLSAGANATQLTVTSTDAGASAAPTIALVRNSATPAASDQLGHINFVGEDAGSNATTYAQIIANIVDPTGGGEDGSLDFYCIEAGTAVKALNLTGGDVSLPTDAAILKFGADSDVTLTHVHDTGLLLNSTMALQFNDASQYINAPTATVLDINATDEVEINATLADVNANLDVSGTYQGGGTMTTGGNIVIPDSGTIGSASDTDAIAIRDDGNVGINSSGSDTVKLSIYDNTDSSGDPDTSNQLLAAHQDHADNTRVAVQITNDGTGIGLYSQKNGDGTGSAVYAYNNSSVSAIASRGHSVLGYGGYFSTNSSSSVGCAGFGPSSTHYGYLGYSTLGVYGTSIQSGGAITGVTLSISSTKNFRISHGLREGHDLVHSSIEGPQIDVVYRGKVELVNGQASIDIDSHYDMTSGTFEWLTKSDSVQTFTSNETGWDAVRSSFSGDTITIECQNSSSTDTISWMVIAERGDPDIMESSTTDNEGNLIIEPESEPELELPPPPNFEPPPEN